MDDWPVSNACYIERAIFFCLWAWRARETSVRGRRVCKDGHQSAKCQWGIKTDGFQHGKFFVRMASLQKEIALKKIEFQNEKRIEK